MARKRTSERPRTQRSPGKPTQDGGEFRGRGVVRTALIRGNTFAARSVQYVEVDGLALFEGDIVLGTVEELEQASEQLRAEMASGVAAGVLISGSQFRWPNCRVPYTIDPALPNQARVTDAIAHWETHTRFRFVQRTTESDYVTFRPGSGCSASVGRRGGQQFVNLAAGCGLGNTIHEIGHVVGLWHEQSREDRDLFVRINWAKIQPGTEHNFNQHITDGDDVGAYDFGSMMHYPRNAFSIDGTDTITPIAPVPPGTTIGQRTALSAGDIAAANSMCPKIAKEGPKDALKDIRKEVLKEIPRDTLKERIKEIRYDTRKEMIRDTLKEGVFDPGPTLAENLITPGRPVLQPGPLLPGRVGALPFAVATPHEGGPGAEGASEVAANIGQLDAELQQLAEQLAQADSVRQSLQEQYNETAALLAQLIQEHERSGS